MLRLITATDTLLHTAKTRVVGLVKSTDGATAIEYGLIAALVAVGLIAALTALGKSLSKIFTHVSTTLNTASS